MKPFKTSKTYYFQQFGKQLEIIVFSVDDFEIKGDYIKGSFDCGTITINLS